MAADDGDLGMAGGEHGEIHRSRLPWKLPGSFDPSVLKDDGFQFAGTADDGVDGGIGAAAGNPEFNADHGTTFDVTVDLVETGIDVVGRNVGEAENTIGGEAQTAEDVIVGFAQLVGGGVILPGFAEVNAEALDTHAIGEAEDFAHVLFGG
jgi:hypothetical protein